MEKVVVALGLVALFSEGCVVYRDRMVSIGTRTEVRVCGTARGDSVAWPDPPRTLTTALLSRSLGTVGTWRDDPTYGRVWSPDLSVVGEDFMPYVSRGRWLLTSGGWYWQSDDPWGRVTFHYGRWVQTNTGWGWMPGTTFAPAWVDWRVGGGWVGWSPSGPEGSRRHNPYAYCSTGRMTEPGLATRVVRGAAATSLYPRTQGVGTAVGYGGTVYGWGPRPGEAGAGGDPVVPVERAWAEGTPRSGAPDGEGDSVTGRPVPTPLVVVQVEDLPGIPSVRTGAESSDGEGEDGEAVAWSRDDVVGPRRRTISLGYTYDSNNPTAPMVGTGGGASVSRGSNGNVAVRAVRSLPPPAAMPGTGYGVGMGYRAVPLYARGGSVSGPVSGGYAHGSSPMPQATSVAAPSGPMLGVAGTGGGGYVGGGYSSGTAMPAPAPTVGPNFDVR